MSFEAKSRLRTWLHWIIMAGLVGWPGVVVAKKAQKATEAEITEAKELCEHWGGEEPYDAERAKEIAKGVRRDCGAAVRKALAGLRRFPKSAAIRKDAQALVDLLPEKMDKVQELKRLLRTKG